MHPLIRLPSYALCSMMSAWHCVKALATAFHATMQALSTGSVCRR